LKNCEPIKADSTGGHLKVVFDRAYEIADCG